MQEISVGPITSDAAISRDEMKIGTEMDYHNGLDVLAYPKASSTEVSVIFNATDTNEAVAINQDAGRNVNTVSFVGTTNDPRLALLGAKRRLTTHHLDFNLTIVRDTTVVDAEKTTTSVISSASSTDRMRLAIATRDVLQIHDVGSDLQVVSSQKASNRKWPKQLRGCCLHFGQ